MTVSLNQLDLNLLRVFSAVMEEQSVLRASQRVCLSQSAVSHALGRLRSMLADELFIRTPTGMQPTARALAMAPLIREAWRALEAAIGTPHFEPSKSTRRFTIAAGELISTVMIPNLLDLLEREAPFLDVVIRPDSEIDLMEHISLGKIDVAIGTYSTVPDRLRSRSLFTYEDVLITSSSNRRSGLPLEALSRLTLAAVSSQIDYDSPTDNPAAERGLSRRSEMFDRTALESAVSTSEGGSPMALLVPHFLALPSLLMRTEIAAIAPQPLAESLARMHPLSIYELPYKASPTAVHLLWHERAEKDPAQQWLREMLCRATGHLRHSRAPVDRMVATKSSVARPSRIAAEATAVRGA
jgi:DNA-binding transcriptional LysR family regulator